MTAESLLAKVFEAEPSNPQAKDLLQLVLKERVEREKSRRLLQGLKRAQAFWTQQNYGDCLNLLQDLEHDFPAEEEVVRLLETVREDQQNSKSNRVCSNLETCSPRGATKMLLLCFLTYISNFQPT